MRPGGASQRRAGRAVGQSRGGYATFRTARTIWRVAAGTSASHGLLYASGALLALGNGLTQPTVSAYISKRADPTAQGNTLGTNQSFAALASALAERHAPVVRVVEQTEECGHGEPFVPTDVDLLFGEPTVALRGPWNRTDLVKIAPSARDLVDRYEYHLDFPGDPLNAGCEVVKCPSCGYQFPRRSRIVDLARRMFGSGERR